MSRAGKIARRDRIENAAMVFQDFGGLAGIRQVEIA